MYELPYTFSTGMQNMETAVSRHMNKPSIDISIYVSIALWNIIGMCKPTAQYSLVPCLVLAGMFNIAKMKNRPMILIGGWVSLINARFLFRNKLMKETYDTCGKLDHHLWTSKLVVCTMGAWLKMYAWSLQTYYVVIAEV